MNLIQGQQDRPLSPKGFVQRKNLFFLLQSVPLSRIFTSTLQRTIQTALPISEARQIPLASLTELNEAKLGVFEGENKSDFSDDFSKKMYQSFLDDEINVVLPGGGENLKMLNKRICTPVSKILNAVKSNGHCLVVAHRNVNKMIVKNLLGLSIEEGYRVEHQHNCMYIYAPEKEKIFFTEITSSGEPIEIAHGYEKIESE